jgi:alanine dehydrogenase
MLLLSRTDALLDIPSLIDALERAMADLSAGRASMPNRTAVNAEADSLLLAMAAYDPSNKALAAKLVSLAPGNAGTHLPTHQGAIVVFDPATGEPIALMDGTYITATRTAAGSALSTRLLARPHASVLAIIGTGAQARSHARAVSLVRDFEELRVGGRDPEKAQLLARELADAGLPAVAMDSIEAAVTGADVVCATTHAQDPVIHHDWLKAGAHVTSVGYAPDGRELDAATIENAYVVVESRGTALAAPPAGSTDLLHAIGNDLLRAEDVAEIGEVVAGTRPGRSSEGQLTVYKSVGVAVQDAAAAAQVLAAAKSAGVGIGFRLGD